MASNKPKAAGPADKGLRVVARPMAGFRRCGYHFSAEGTTLALSELSAEQVAELRDEPNLMVVDVDITA
jgi:Mu-like prophage FluMu N-terminal domain